MNDAPDGLTRPTWSLEEPHHPLDSKVRIAELQQILGEKAYHPEEQKPNIELAIELYQDGTLPLPVGEFVHIQDGRLWETPNRILGAPCYWTEGVVTLGSGRVGFPVNDQSKRSPFFDPTLFPEPTTDEERATRKLQLEGLGGKLVDPSRLEELRRARGPLPMGHPQQSRSMLRHCMIPATQQEAIVDNGFVSQCGMEPGQARSMTGSDS